MTKAELVAAINAKANLGSKAKADGVLNVVLASITEALANGETVTLTGFGSFKVANRAARVGRNPRTGQEIQIPASKAATFSAGKALKDALK